MKIKLFYKKGYTNIINTVRDYARCKEDIDAECGSLENYNKFVLEDVKTRTDISKFEIIEM